MLKFIELIKSIGFTEGDFSAEDNLKLIGMKVWSYNSYIIVISHDRWSISKDIESHTGHYRNWLRFNNNQRNFLLDEIGLLEKHFKAELRELKLNTLLTREI